MSKASFQKRLWKELNELASQNIEGIKVDQEKIKDFSEWCVDVSGAPGTLYENEKFVLKFTFSSNYPFESPQVIFIGDHIPIHPHVYSNGHICLSILTEDWTPAMTVASVCLSIISMLSSCTEKKRPPYDSSYVKRANKNPKLTRWVFHDDKA